MYDDRLEIESPGRFPNTVKLILRNNIATRTVYGNKASGDAGNEALNDAISEALNDTERIIIEIIRKFPQASQKEIAKKAEFSRSKVQRTMKNLVEKKVIYREGARKNGVWRVTGQQE